MTSNRPVNIARLIADTGLLLVLAGTAMPLFFPTTGMFLTTRWIYTAGAALCIAGRVIDRLRPAGADEPLRLRRLRRLELWSSVMFGVGAAFMFLRNVGATDWIAFTLAGGALTAYTSIMIPRLSSPRK